MSTGTRSTFFLIMLVTVPLPQTVGFQRDGGSSWLGWILGSVVSKLFARNEKNSFVDPQMNLDVLETILYHGYPAEAHEVTSSDGYVLTLHRIPYGRSRNRRIGPPVIVFPGFQMASAGFVANFAHNSLGFVLADNGFDVWLHNTRGSVYSRRHVTLSPEDSDFWKFSLDEVIASDSPAVIDYVLKTTGEPYLTAVTYSKGTAELLGLLATRTSYNGKVKSIFALAPYVTPLDGKTPAALLAPFATPLQLSAEAVGIHEVLPARNWFVEQLCGHPGTECAMVYRYLLGSSEVNLNVTRIPLYTQHFPAGASVRLTAHLFQMYSYQDFHYFDYGEKQNLVRYGQKQPPRYDLSRVRSPVGLIWGAGDVVSSPAAVRKLRGRLGPRVFLDHRIPYDEFDHMDFGWGVHSDSMYLRDLVRFMNQRK